MITVRSFLNYIRTAALTVTAVLLLGGCSAVSDGDLPFIPLGEEVERVSEYRVVISRGSSGTVIDRAEKLCGEIKEQTGVDTLLFYDDDTLLYKENSHEITVGMTSRTVSRILLRRMRRDDYICAVEGERTVIGGRSDSATVAAIDRFCNEILPVSSDERLIPEGGGFSYVGEYPVERVSILGVELSEYTIEVSASGGETLNAAYELRQNISDKTGYILDVTLGSAAGRRIRLNVVSTGKSETAYVETDAMGVILTADRENGLKYAAEKFCGMIEESGGGEVSLPSRTIIPYDDASIKIRSACLSSLLPFGSAQGLNAAVDMIESGDTDVVFCGEMTDIDYQRLCSAVSDKSVCSVAGTAVFVSDGQPFSVTSLGIVREEGRCTVERFKIESARLKIVLYYVCGESETPTCVTLVADEGYIPVAIVHTSGGVGVTVERGGVELTPTVKTGSFTCYGDENGVDITQIYGESPADSCGEIEIFAR